MQRTFGPIVGLEEIVPCRPHPTDIVECSDGSTCERRDAFEDCRGNPHSNEDDRDAADVTIVEEILDALDVWVTENCCENSDYTEAYDHVVYEVRNEWPVEAIRWIKATYGDHYGRTKFDEFIDHLAEAVCDDLDDSVIDGEWIYDCNEYSCYSGSGCCLWGFDIGEHEEQIDISYYPEFERLYREFRLADVLEKARCDVSVGSYALERIRERNEKWGLPCFETYHCPGGRWDFVVSEERMRQAVANGIIRLCRKRPA